MIGSVFLGFFWIAGTDHPTDGERINQFRRTAHMILVIMGDQKQVDGIPVIVRKHVQNCIRILHFPGIDDHGMIFRHKNGAVRSAQLWKYHREIFGLLPAAAQQQDHQQPQNRKQALTECGHGY